MRDMLQSRLVLYTNAWWSWRVLLDERFAPHDDAEAESRNESNLNVMIALATQCAVSSASGLRTLSLSQSVWKCKYR